MSDKKGTPCTQSNQSAPAEETCKKCAKKKQWMCIGGAVLAVLLALLLIFGIRTPRSTARKVLNAFEKGNVKTIMQLLPKEYKEKVYGDAAAQEQFRQTMQDHLDKELAELDTYGLSVKFKVIGVNKLEDNALKSVQDNYTRYNAEVKAAKEITVKATLNDNGTKYHKEFTITIVSISGNWYLDSYSIYHILQYIESPTTMFLH